MKNPLGFGIQLVKQHRMATGLIIIVSKITTLYYSWFGTEWLFIAARLKALLGYLPYPPSINRHNDTPSDLRRWRAFLASRFA